MYTFILPRLTAKIFRAVLIALAVIAAHSHAQAQTSTFPDPVCKKNGSKNLVIFIHGWQGDRDSWKSFPKLICDDPDLASVDVISLNYPTYLVRQSASIAEVADWFVAQLHARQLHHKYGVIILCAHSMGGLIARKMVILEMLSSGNPGSFKLLLEFGTPHLGVNIGVVDKLAAILGIARDAADEMSSDSRFLRGLRIDWNRIQQRGGSGDVPRTECFASPQDEIVPITSAFYQCDNGTTFLSGSHTDLVKPEAASDDRYFTTASKIIPFLGD